MLNLVEIRKGLAGCPMTDLVSIKTMAGTTFSLYTDHEYNCIHHEINNQFTELIKI